MASIRADFLALLKAFAPEHCEGATGEAETALGGVTRAVGGLEPSTRIFMHKLQIGVAFMSQTPLIAFDGHQDVWLQA